MKVNLLPKKIISSYKFVGVNLVITFFGLLLLPSAVEAQSSGQPGPSIDTVTLNNPLNNISSIEDLLTAILYIFMTLMIPVIVFFIILAGFKYVTAQGNASKVEEANRALLYAVIGAVLILGAVAISDIIQSTVDAF